MKHLVIAFIVAAGLVAPAGAQTPSASGAAAENAWARATPGGAKTGAIYLTLVNYGSDGDRLLGVATPVAEHAQLHQESVENGIMKMRPVTDVEVKPGASLALKPGGTHIMLTGLKQSLKEGDTFPLTLDFAKAGKQEVQVKVAKTGTMGMDAMGSTTWGIWR
jgi:copper(I)-binding protein